MNKQTDLTSELCELNYEKNKQLLEDLLLTTIWGMFIIFLLIKLLFNCNIIECIKYTFMLIGAPYSIRYFLGEFEISFSIFGILIFIIEAVIFLFVGSILTLFLFVHYACQAEYYYRKLKKISNETESLPNQTTNYIDAIRKLHTNGFTIEQISTELGIDVLLIVDALTKD